jgi:outer membrane protein assembly factor BamB
MTAMTHPLAALAAALCLTTLPARAQQELFKWTASDTGETSFGRSVALAGNRALVGTWELSSSDTPGKVYLYDVETGAELSVWQASDGVDHDLFGRSLDMSGNLAIVGASRAPGPFPVDGAAYLFDVTTGQELHKLVSPASSPASWFGTSVALHEHLALVGEPNLPYEGRAHLFNTQTGAPIWEFRASDGEWGEYFGESVALSGSLVIIGAPRDDDGGNNSGSVYMFDTAFGVQLLELTDPAGASYSNFGQSVAISGDRLVVGAPGQTTFTGPGTAYIFDAGTGALLNVLHATGGGANQDFFGHSVAISGDRILVGSPGTNGDGSAFVFDLYTGAQLYELTASDGAPADFFGGAVAQSGDRSLIGAPHFLGLEWSASYLFAVDGPGVNYCAASPNSTSQPSLIAALGSPSVSDDYLTLSATNAPPGQPAIFFAGANAASLPFGDGVLCATGTIIRLNPIVAESGGLFTKSVDLATHGAVLSGMGTTHFQCWYRDPAAGGAGFNLSDGLALQLEP